MRRIKPSASRCGRDHWQGRQGNCDPGEYLEERRRQAPFAETKAKLGAPSILVNKAERFTFGPLEAVTEEEFHRQFDTNVLGTLRYARSGERL